MIAGEERFDIRAKAEHPPAIEAELREMLQHLLEDRFQLKWHRGECEEHGFALVAAKNGPKLEQAKETDVTSFGPFNKGNSTIAISPRRITMAALANFLSNFGARGPVADETGLKGDYNFKLSGYGWNRAGLRCPVSSSIPLIARARIDIRKASSRPHI